MIKFVNLSRTYCSDELSYLARSEVSWLCVKNTLQRSWNPPASKSYYADKETLYYLVKGFTDEDIPHQVLGVVQEMDQKAGV